MNKEEPKPPETPPKAAYSCGGCKYPLSKKWHFCPECGMVTGR